jgi:hypothetical protein
MENVGCAIYRRLGFHNFALVALKNSRQKGGSCGADRPREWPLLGGQGFAIGLRPPRRSARLRSTSIMENVRLCNLSKVRPLPGRVRTFTEVAARERNDSRFQRCEFRRDHRMILISILIPLSKSVSRLLKRFCCFNAANHSMPMENFKRCRLFPKRDACPRGHLSPIVFLSPRFFSQSLQAVSLPPLWRSCRLCSIDNPSILGQV